MFKIGDVVLCVINDGYVNKLNFNIKYMVSNIRTYYPPGRDSYMEIKILGYNHTYSSEQFILARYERRLKIEKIKERINVNR